MTRLLSRTRGLVHAAAVAAACGILASAQAAPVYDVAIVNGRVMDPETGFDAVANVGIKDGVISTITTDSITGRHTINAKGLVVAPGFIDLHAHAQEPHGQGLQVRDGVTTALEQEAGAYPIAPFYAQREGRALINFGASVSHMGMRVRVKTGIEPERLAEGGTRTDEVLRLKQKWAESPMEEAELARLLDLFRSEVAAGGLGLGLATEYVPGTDRREVYELMKTAAEAKVPVFTHVRAAYHAGPGGLFEMVQEAIANTAATGGALHVCHVTSKGLNDTTLILDAISGARQQGMDITTEMYPYTAGSTMIGSALFNEGWRERWNSDYSDIEWPATGERLTEETFHRYRRESPSAFIVFHMIPQAALDAAIRHPLVMIASDGISLADGHGHPRGAGTYARVLGVHVRERGDLTLMEALRKMTLMPAQRMAFVPAMQRKGRVQEGMDADITIFDPATVKDRATYREPAQPSAGILHVLVGGTPVVANGQLRDGVFPGRGIRLER
ncbi:MAG TPA: amidohydrolase family protein [Steroidobacter sp.]